MTTASSLSTGAMATVSCAADALAAVPCAAGAIVTALPSCPRSFKLAAELQHQLGGHGSPQRNPLVIRIEVKAGHGAGKPTAKIIQETADCHAFVAKVMGAEWALG